MAQVKKCRYCERELDPAWLKKRNDERRKAIKETLRQRKSEGLNVGRPKNNKAQA